MQAKQTQATEKKVVTPDMKKGKFQKGIGQLKNLGQSFGPFAKKKDAVDYSFDDRASYLLLRVWWGSLCY